MSASTDPTVYGGIEAGGTKFICALGGAHTGVLARAAVPTAAPAETLAAVCDFFAQAQAQHGRMVSLGLACFGPLTRGAGQAGYGCIGHTPKPGWSGLAIRQLLAHRLQVPVVLDTDVHGALLAEAALGAGRGAGCMVYVTVGTGIGGAFMLDGRPASGHGHPELGHVLLPLLPEDAGFSGVCPFHGARCAEGLASGPALAARVGAAAADLPAGHPVWQLEARYLAMLCHNLLLSVAPEKIVLGGGVMQQQHLFAALRAHLEISLAGYGRAPGAAIDLASVIVPSALGGDAGILGALMMAQQLHCGPLDTRP